MRGWGGEREKNRFFSPFETFTHNPEINAPAPFAKVLYLFFFFYRFLLFIYFFLNFSLQQSKLYAGSNRGKRLFFFGKRPRPCSYCLSEPKLSSWYCGWLMSATSQRHRDFFNEQINVREKRYWVNKLIYLEQR